MLTGRYAWRTRLQEWVIASYEPPLISQDRLTLPEFLRQQGYHTSMHWQMASGLELAWSAAEQNDQGAQWSGEIRMGFY